MKTLTWFGIAMIFVSLVLASGTGQAQAIPQKEETASTQGNTRWVKEYVDQPGDVGSHTSIAFDPGNGTPWISYYDDTNTALKVAHRVSSGGNCGLSNDWYCSTVDSSGNVGMYSSIDVHPDDSSLFNNRLVGVAYYDTSNSALKFAEYSCITLPCTWRIVTVQDAEVYLGAPSYGQYTSLKYTANGNPRIAYYTSNPLGSDALKFATEVDSGGNCGEGDAAEKWNCETVDSGEGMGQYVSLSKSEFVNTHIAYYNGNTGDLKYAYYAGFGGNCGTDNTWSCATVDGTDGSDVGKFVSIHAQANASDKLQFAYYDTTHGKLKYAVHVGGGGNCGEFNNFQCDNIESIGTGLTKVGISLAVDSNNVPIIAYMNASEDQGPSSLKVAQPAYSLGLLYGNCGPETPFSTWQCTFIDGGGAHQDEAAYASIVLNPSGLAMIAYSELETYDSPNEYNLKIAYQRLMLYLPIVIRN